MISSLTSLGTDRAALDRDCDLQPDPYLGVVGIANRYAVTYNSPSSIKMEVLSGGFDIAFLLSLALGFVILAISFALKEEIHPDYAEEAKLLRKWH